MTDHRDARTEADSACTTPQPGTQLEAAIREIAAAIRETDAQALADAWDDGYAHGRHDPESSINPYRPGTP